MKKKTGKKRSAKDLLARTGLYGPGSAFPPALPRKANFIIISLIFTWAFILYGNTMRNKFTIDDTLLTKNEMVRQGFKAIPAVFSSYLIDEDKNTGGTTNDYRPFAKATFAFEYGLWGEKPGASHLVNVFFYFIACLITFYVLRRLLISFNILFPVLITVLFMAHPVHNEVVASLRNRDEILAYMFGMMGLYSLLSYTYSRNIRYILHTCIWFVLAFLNKQSAIPFIGLYILVLYYFSDLKPRAIISIGVLLITAAVTAFLVPRFFLHHGLRSNFYFENALYFEKSFWLRLGTAMLSLLFYLRILFYPHPLLYYYGYNMIPLTSLGSALVQLSILIYAILLFSALVNIRRKTLLSFAVLWYLIAVFMYSNLLLPVTGVVAERFVFLASLGFVMALVFIIFKLFGTEPNSLTIELDSRIKIITLVMVILIPWGLITFNRNAAWRDMMTLFKTDIPHLRHSAKANYQYAEYMLNTVYGDEDYRKYGMVNPVVRETIRTHLGLSLSVYPKGYNTLNDYGNFFLLIEKRYDSALYYFHRAVEVDSTLAPGWINLGMTYRQLGQYPRALNCYQKVLILDPGNSRAYISLSDLYYDLGDINRSLYYSDLGRKASGKK